MINVVFRCWLLHGKLDFTFQVFVRKAIEKGVEVYRSLFEGKQFAKWELLKPLVQHFYQYLVLCLWCEGTTSLKCTAFFVLVLAALSIHFARLRWLDLFTKRGRKQLGNIIKADRNVSAVKSEIFTSDGVLKWNKNRDGW